MVSGEGTAANSGYLEVSLTRESDGFTYAFSSDPVTSGSDVFAPMGGAKRFSFEVKDQWAQFGAAVILPADAQRDSYTVQVKGRGRTDANTDNRRGFCYYAMRNFCLGPMQGWRTYLFGTSGLGDWSLSSSANRCREPRIFSGLVFSSLLYNSLTADDRIAHMRDGVRSRGKNQLVQNFVGMEPTKSYQLEVKGKDTDMANTALRLTLKAKSPCKRTGSNYNVLGGWMMDSADPSSVFVVGGAAGVNIPPFNPYSNNGKVQRRTYPQFNRNLANINNKPTDWGIYVGPSGSAYKSTGASNFRANAGDYRLSMDVYNSGDHGSYFVLSSAPGAFYNWDTAAWDSFGENNRPTYRRSTSGSYFLPLPSDEGGSEFTHYTYPSPINFNSTDLETYTETTVDGIGSRGQFSVGAAIFGPNFSGGGSLINNISLEGPGLEPNVDIWKELWYDFDNQNWLTSPVSGTPVTTGETTSNSRQYSSKMITNMAFYGLDRHTEYQLNVIPYNGGVTTFNEISLTDMSLVCNQGRDRWIRDADIWTSEPYNNGRYDQFGGNTGTVFKAFDAGNFSNVQDPSSFTSKFDMWNIVHPTQNDGTTSGTGYVQVINFYGFNNDNPRPWLLQNFTLEDYDLKGGDRFAFGIDCVQKVGRTTTCSASVQAQYNGKNYHYNFTNQDWVEGPERREKGFKGLMAVADYPDDLAFNDDRAFSHLLTPTITAPTFGPNTKIIASFRYSPNNASNLELQHKNFSVYSVTPATPKTMWMVSGDTFNFPEFPQPHDRTLQPVQPSGYPGYLGHFLNRINGVNYKPTWVPGQADGTTGFSSVRVFTNPAAPTKTGETTMQEAITMGAYLPSAGLFFGSGTFGMDNSEQPWGLDVSAGAISGVLNQLGVVNTDGYIYRHPLNQATADRNVADASAGFIVSSYQTGAATYSPRVVRYVLKVHKDDWRFLDWYMGGVGAIGLHTLNYKKSFQVENSAYQISGTGADYPASPREQLYKVSDPTRNPVFNLSNKKAIFPPGLKIDYHSTDYLTIIWDIDF